MTKVSESLRSNYDSSSYCGQSIVSKQPSVVKTESKNVIKFSKKKSSQATATEVPDS